LLFGRAPQRVPPFPRSKHHDECAARRQAMSMRTTSSALCRGALAAALALTLGGCDVLTASPVPDWPGPHAPYPFPDNIPHRTE
jgi:hypothetical protein